ncbi:MAG: YicC family protein, partial [Deltaproteobacteria bacterium]|nr:YicC family protein [Deltaproteobacteria bacterium]
CSWTVEIRSVNHRYLETSIKSPRKFIGWDDKMKKEIGAFHNRGRIDIFIAFNDEGLEKAKLKTDLGLAKEYMRCLREIAGELAIKGEPDLAMLASYREIITPLDEEIGTEELAELWPALKEAINIALQECLQMRRSEGEILQNDLLEHLTVFQQKIAAIETSLPMIIEKRKTTLQERLENLLSGIDIDPMRLAQEVAILVDKSDVNEEIVRLRSHMEQFQRFLNLTEPVGRRLDFLVQEFLREVNTIASKINHAETAHLIVGMKNDLEKIREQVQNLE